MIRRIRRIISIFKSDTADPPFLLLFRFFYYPFQSMQFRSEITIFTQWVEKAYFLGLTSRIGTVFERGFHCDNVFDQSHSCEGHIFSQRSDTFNFIKRYFI